MTVRELIKFLNDKPQDISVVMDRYSDTIEVGAAHSVRLWHTPGQVSYYYSKYRPTQEMTDVLYLEGVV